MPHLTLDVAETPASLGVGRLFDARVALPAGWLARELRAKASSHLPTVPLTYLPYYYIRTRTFNNQLDNERDHLHRGPYFSSRNLGPSSAVPYRRAAKVRRALTY